MGFRTVIVSSRAKLEVRLNYLVVRGEAEKKVFIDEISTLIIQSTAVSLTAALLSELIKRNIKVIFCDEKCNPASELLPYYGAHNTPKRYRRQISWREETKADVWKEIIVAKICAQAAYLDELGFTEQAGMLKEYSDEVLPSDITNREGHAAKVYFNCLFGDEGSRHSGGFFNACLNYGYTVLLSAFNREIVASGYLTQIGIWHNNEFNEFNLACDFMEPLRVIVDRTARNILPEDENFKKILVAMFGYKTLIDGKKTTLDVAIRTYVKSLFNALEADDASLILFPQITDMGYEL